jgi:hypothetical protein
VNLDTEEVDGSSPFGPTIIFNHFAGSTLLTLRICVATCVVTTLAFIRFARPSLWYRSLGKRIRKCVESVPFRRQPHMRVVIQHPWRYMTGVSHNRLIASLRLCQLRDGVVAKIVKNGDQQSDF